MTILNDKHEIINNLWIGNRFSSWDERFIKENNIKLIINCSRHLKFIDIEGIKKIRIDVEDDGSLRTNKIIYKKLDSIIHKMNKYLSNNKGVLVHCSAGMQRSATIVTAYLINKNKMSKRDGIKFVRSKRVLAFLPMAFYGLLLSRYEHKINN